MDRDPGVGTLLVPFPFIVGFSSPLEENVGAGRELRTRWRKETVRDEATTLPQFSPKSGPASCHSHCPLWEALILFLSLRFWGDRVWGQGGALVAGNHESIPHSFSDDGSWHRPLKLD